MVDLHATRDVRVPLAELHPRAVAPDAEGGARRRARRGRGSVTVRADEPLTPELGTFLTRRLATAQPDESGTGGPDVASLADALLLADEPWPPDLALLFLRRVAALLDEADASGIAIAPFTPRCLALDGPYLVLAPVDDAAGADAAYVAPEQRAGGAEPTARAGQYGLATLAMAILTPDDRVAGGSGRLRAARRARAQPAEAGRPHGGLDPAVVRVLLAGRAAEPERRFSTAGDFVVALDAACGEWAQPARPASIAPLLEQSAPPRVGPGLARLLDFRALDARRLALGAGLLGIAALGGGVGWLVARGPARDAPAGAAPATVAHASGGETVTPLTATAAVAPRGAPATATPRRGLRPPRVAADALSRPDDPEPSWAPAPLPSEPRANPTRAAEPSTSAPARERKAERTSERTASGRSSEPSLPSLPSSAARRLQALASAVAVPDADRLAPPARSVVDPSEFAAGSLRPVPPRAGDSAQGRRTTARPEVDATPAPGSPSPSYPPALLARRVSGEVVARFAVDSDGRVDVGSFRVIRTTNTSFTGAVRAVLGRMRYLPAESGGQRVRQTVEQVFRFDVPR